jgi:hypothetical protein
MSKGNSQLAARLSGLPAAERASRSRAKEKTILDLKIINSI